MTPLTAGTAGPPLTRIAEWSFLRFVRKAYGAIEPAGPSSPPLALGDGLSGTGRNRPLFAWLTPVLVRGTMQWLARRGGYRRRDVVVKGRLRTGRLWDEPVWGTETLTIGAPTVAWLAAIHEGERRLEGRAPATWVESMARGGDAADAATDALRAAARSWPLAPGDRLALSAAFDLLVAAPATTDFAAVAPRATSLPLFLLLHPRLVPADGPLAFSLGDDLEGLALQYFDDAIARAWLAEIQRVRLRATTEERIAAFTRLSRLLAALFAASRSGSGDHFLSAVARFFPLLWRDLGNAIGVADYVGRGAEVAKTTAERESFERAFGDVLAFGPLLDARVEQIVGTPWADRTEEQKRLASEHETRYREIREEVRVLARRLRREIG